MLRERAAQFEEGTFDGLDPSQMDMATLEIQIDLACIDLVSQGLAKYTVDADGEIRWYAVEGAPECSLGWEEMKEHFKSVKKLNL